MSDTIEGYVAIDGSGEGNWVAADTRIFAVTVAIEAPTPDEAIRSLCRLLVLPVDELAERCQVTEIIGDPTLDQDWTMDELREALGVGA